MWCVLGWVIGMDGFEFGLEFICFFWVWWGLESVLGVVVWGLEKWRSVLLVVVMVGGEVCLDLVNWVCCFVWVYVGCV